MRGLCAHSPVSIVCLLVVLLWLVPSNSYGKECTNIPTELASHTLRARSLLFPQVDGSSLPHFYSSDPNVSSIALEVADLVAEEGVGVPGDEPVKANGLKLRIGMPDKLGKDVPSGGILNPLGKRKKIRDVLRTKSEASHVGLNLRESVVDEVKGTLGQKNVDLGEALWRQSRNFKLKKALSLKNPLNFGLNVHRYSHPHPTMPPLDQSLPFDEGIPPTKNPSRKFSQFKEAVSHEDMFPEVIKRQRTLGFLREVSLHRVTLAPDSPQGTAQETNLQYLLMLDVDRLVWNFRKTAKLEAPSRPYGGWESSESELRGHFVGHYLSATALMWAGTHHKELQAKMKTLLKALKECQTQLGTGYLSAFPSDFFDRFEGIQPVWAPYYTIHKIMAGLLDQYTLVGNRVALDMVVAMARYFYKRVESVIERFTIERHWHSLNEETGGMNDVLYRLYTVTGDADHLKLAHLFDKPCFLGPLALQTDNLSGFHANTHIPVVVGAQMRYEVTGDALYRSIAEYFMSVVNTSHSYATGGTSVSEFWVDPMRQANTLQTENQESCTTYNMLKIARNLFRWTKVVAYADYYERALVNGILGLQRGQEPGVMLYMLPLGPGMSKARSYHGWGNKFNSFWCCYGSAIESFAKLGDSIYFEEDGSTPAIYIVQFVASSLIWDTAGLFLNQTIEPFTSEDPNLRVTFEFFTNSSKETEAAVHIRVPSWTDSLGCGATLNGQKLLVPAPGSYLSIVRKWAFGDKLLLVLPLSLRTERIQDDRPKYASIHAILFGPYVMAGMSIRDWRLGSVADPSTPSEWVVPVPQSHFNQLYMFSQESVTETQGTLALCLGHYNGSAVMGPVPLDGTDEAAYSTFRLAIPLVDILEDESTSKKLLGILKHDVNGNVVSTMDKGLVSLELFSEPGRYLAHKGEDSSVVVVDEVELRASSPQFKSAESRDSHFQLEKSRSGVGKSMRHSAGRIEQWGYQPLLSQSENVPDILPRVLSGPHSRRGTEQLKHQTSDSRAIDSVFQVRPGLSGNKNTVSFEAVSNPGCFLSSKYDGTTDGPVILLKCRPMGTDDKFNATSTFTVERGMASYHPFSFVAKGGKRNFLLAPLSSFRDESYTTYFDIY